VIDKIAGIRGITPQEVEQITEKNGYDLFGTGKNRIGMV
jgi:Tat protein secretion system quality control protein TatD with DNase activity